MKYDMQTMKCMALFDKITRTGLKDCFVEENCMYFVVPNKDIRRAVGPEGKNVKTLERLLKRRIKLVGFHDDAVQFLRNLHYPIDIQEVSIEGGVLTVSTADRSSRGILIGRNAQNLRRTELILKRYFPISELRVS